MHNAVLQKLELRPKPAMTPPDPDKPVRAVEAPEPAPEAFYREALPAVARAFQAAARVGEPGHELRVEVHRLRDLGPRVVAAGMAGRGLLRTAMGAYADGDGFVVPHSANVAIVSVEIGRELGLGPDRLLSLCLAGFVHDLGSVKLPRGLLTKPGILSPEERRLMRTRPRHGRDILRALGDEFEGVAEIVYQMYERLDGSGYPEALQGEAILREARILGAADLFESFAHPRPGRARVSGTSNEAIRKLTQSSQALGPAIVKVLVERIGIFPIGSYIALSGGEVGRVIDVRKENPMRPQVEILLESTGRPPIEPRCLDLIEMPQVHVKRALDAADLTELGLLPPPTEFPPIERP